MHNLHVYLTKQGIDKTVLYKITILFLTRAWNVNFNFDEFIKNNVLLTNTLKIKLWCTIDLGTDLNNSETNVCWEIKW